MACNTRKYVNLTPGPIRYEKGLGGVPWPGCDAEPGGVIEAPDSDGYHRLCLEAGFTPWTPEIQAKIDEDAQLRAMLAADEAKVVPVVEETPAATPAVEPEKPAVVPLTPAPEVKRRGRRN